MLLPVYKMYANEWFQYVKLQNINGVFGMAYFAEYQDNNSFWYNMIAQDYDTTMAVSLVPTSTDVSWIPAMSSVNFTNASNTLMIGENNRTLYIANNTNTSITMTSAKPNIWKFDTHVYFGMINTTNTSSVTQYYAELTNSTYN